MNLSLSYIKINLSLIKVYELCIYAEISQFDSKQKINYEKIEYETGYRIVVTSTSAFFSFFVIRSWVITWSSPTLIPFFYSSTTCGDKTNISNNNRDNER